MAGARYGVLLGIVALLLMPLACARSAEQTITIAVVLTGKSNNRYESTEIKASIEMLEKRTVRNGQRINATILNTLPANPNSTISLTTIVQQSYDLIMIFANRYTPRTYNTAKQYPHQQFVLYITEQSNHIAPLPNVSVFFIDYEEFDFLLGYSASLLSYAFDTENRSAKIAIMGEGIDGEDRQSKHILLGAKAVAPQRIIEIVAIESDMRDTAIQNLVERLSAESVHVIVLFSNQLNRTIIRAAQKNRMVIITKNYGAQLKRGMVFDINTNWKKIITDSIIPQLEQGKWRSETVSIAKKEVAQITMKNKLYRITLPKTYREQIITLIERIHQNDFILPL